MCFYKWQIKVGSEQVRSALLWVVRFGLTKVCIFDTEIPKKKTAIIFNFF